MDVIDSLQEIVSQTVVNLFEQFLLWIPNVIGAIVAFVVGLLLAHIGRDLVVLLLDKIELDRWLSRFHVNDVLKGVGIRLTFSQSVGFVVYWIVLLAFIQSAVGLLGVMFITKFINKILNFVPEMVAFVIVLVVGLTLAEFTARAVKKRFSDKISKWVPGFVKGFIIFLAAVVAVDQLGIDVDFIAKIVANIITAVVAALAIAFGFGGKDKAKEIIERHVK